MEENTEDIDVEKSILILFDNDVKLDDVLKDVSEAALLLIDSVRNLEARVAALEEVNRQQYTAMMKLRDELRTI